MQKTMAALSLLENSTIYRCNSNRPPAIVVLHGTSFELTSFLIFISFYGRNVRLATAEFAPKVSATLYLLLLCFVELVNQRIGNEIT